MPDLNIATVTGVIGAITGCVALVLSIKSYLLVRAMKALDIRLELEKAFNHLDMVLSGIDGYLDYVHESHMRVLAATGRNQSGEMKLFEEDFAKDRTRLRRLLDSQPRRVSNYERLAPSELGKLVVAVHAFHAQVADLRGKYQKLFESDEERRKEIRARHT